MNDMKLLDIITISFQFHRLVYVSLTEKCPIRCRHCFVESGPTRQEHADLNAFRKWVEGIVEAEATEVILFSGGEPLSHPKALRYGLEACSRGGIYSVICTSGYWARSVASAQKVLGSYPHASCLWLSTDIYHEEFVPLSYLRHAAEAAVQAGMDVVFQIVDDDPQHSDFMSRFEQEVGFDLVSPDQVYVTPLSMEGRARQEARPQLVQLNSGRAGIHQVPDMPCPWLGSPWVHEDGIVSACPRLDVWKTPSHPLQLGNLNAQDFNEIAARAEGDAYLQALRVFGPRKIAETFPVEAWGWDRQAFEGSTICDLCNSLASVRELPQRVREYTAGQGLENRINLLRLILYSETLHLTSRARVGATA
jgi:organic radical activating enzyme